MRSREGPVAFTVTKPRRYDYRADMSHEASTMSTLPWASAWKTANVCFYDQHSAERQFRTSIESGTEIARALGRIITSHDAELEQEDFLVIDIGSGSGRLLEQLASLVPEHITLMGLDIRERPPGLDPRILWRQGQIDDSTEDFSGFDGHMVGVVIAHEFLDDIPCTVVELDEDLVPHLILVDPVDGAEYTGPPLDDPAARCLLGQATDEQSAWLDSWWPPTRPMARREIGVDRARLWARLSRIVASGYAVAIDYAHGRTERSAGVWDAGTLRGFSAGRPRSAIPDGSVNITAHVALDALASRSAILRTQSEVLEGTSLRSWPHGLGAYQWLIEPIVRR